MANVEMEKVLQRIKKLLALGAEDSGATEGERDNALRMAHATLAKYNLTMAQVDLVAGRNNQDPRQKGQFDLEADRLWARQAAAGVGKLFFCFYFSETGSITKHIFVGRSLNIMTATYMAEYVITSIRKESNKAAKFHFDDCKLNKLLALSGLDTDGPVMPEATKVAWAEAFCAAAAAKVKERCLEMAKAAANQQAEGSTGTSLVLSDYYKTEMEANAAYIKSLGYQLTSEKATIGRDIGSARQAGASFGSSINLSQQIGSSSATRRLK